MVYLAFASITHAPAVHSRDWFHFETEIVLGLGDFLLEIKPIIAIIQA